jgi:hypothetical protein
MPSTNFIPNVTVIEADWLNEVNTAVFDAAAETPNTAPITAVKKFAESISLKDFGAIGNGVTNDTTAVTAAETNLPVYAPLGTYLTTFANPLSLSGTQYGFGRIKTADTNLSAPNFTIATAAPSSLGNEASILTAFNGDLTKSQNPTSQLISGVATLGQPTTGYKYTPELTPYYTYLRNTSGWNQATANNVGRTAATVFRTRIEQAGQGDVMCYNGSVNVSGAKAGATSFLANPAGALFAGDVATSQNGTYCNPAEWNCSDNGYDVAAIGLVNNFTRTNNTGALNVVWMGYRAQSVGTVACDSFVSASGLWNNGLDLVTANFGTNQSAISLAASQRIYFNNTATPTGGSGVAWVTNNYGGEYVSYNASLGLTTFYGDNTPQFAVGKTASSVNYIAANGSPTGVGPQLRATGTDTNINLGFTTKGTGRYFFYSNTTSPQFSIAGSVTTAVNYVTASGAATGVAPNLTASGPDTDIDIKLNAKGTGVVDFGTQTGAAAGALVGYMVIKISGTSYKIPYYAMA